MLSVYDEGISEEEDEDDSEEASYTSKESEPMTGEEHVWSLVTTDGARRHVQRPNQELGAVSGRGR
jgi:hypothetical protein